MPNIGRAASAISGATLASRFPRNRENRRQNGIERSLVITAPAGQRRPQFDPLLICFRTMVSGH
jgi:hypothetical protein